MDYPKLEKFDFNGIELKLLELKNEIIENEPDEILQKAYKWKINEKLAQLRMMKEGMTGNDKKFAKYSSFIYGKPDRDIFAYTINKIGKRFDEMEGCDNLSDLRKQFAISRLREELPMLNDKYDGEIVDFEKKAGVKKIVFEETERVYEADAIKQIFEWALHNRFIDGWKVIIDKDSSRKGISVSQEKKHIIVPEEKQLTAQELGSLIEHEIGTHVARSYNGERSKLKLLGLGLDRFLMGEEGVSMLAEQRYSAESDYPGLVGHLAISLAIGLDGKKRDFRAVFNILRDYFFIISSEKDGNKAWEGAKDLAWNRCVRTFRGTSCNTSGACLTRDIVYREGNIGLWNVLQINPDEEKRFSIGRYDPNNARHIYMLEQLGISDEDLETLDK